MTMRLHYTNSALLESSARRTPLRWSLAQLVLLAAAAAVVVLPGPKFLPVVSAYRYDNGLGLTPQMGWNPWNVFQCDINETLIEHSRHGSISHSGLILASTNSGTNTSISTIVGSILAIRRDTSKKISRNFHREWAS